MTLTRPPAAEPTVERGRTLMSGTLGTAIRCSGFSCRTTSALPSGAAPRHDRPPPLPFARLVVLIPLDPAIACGPQRRVAGGNLSSGAQHPFPVLTFPSAHIAAAAVAAAAAARANIKEAV